MGQQRDRSRYFTSKGVDLIRVAMQQKGWIEEDLANKIDALTKKDRKDDSSIYESLCKYLSFQRPPQKKNITLIANLLGLNPNDLVEEPLFQHSTTSSREISANEVDLIGASKNLLENLKKLTTESLTAGDGIRFEFDNIFVPLGVVERQEKSKRKQEDGSPDRGSELYAEKVTPISHEVFFEDVLFHGNTKISQGKRIAVIGEAGAGKTTQLQKIGSWLLEKTEYIPVWISLTALGAKSLREYLLEDWVRDASEEMSAPQAWKDSLEQAIESGKVWLLLDGVDEMTVSNPLSHLSSQLREGWLKDVRIVITCRVNVWDAGKNALTDFDVYRNLDFDYPNDVYQFIGNWFVSAPELAEKLKQALEQSGKERIRDMVKNPLRLTLLCYSWQKQQGELPETKAGLYDWFVDNFYEWNKGKTKIELTRSNRDELNRELGELAKLAIDSEDSRFRLTETFIENVMNPDLFELALDLNWLNEVGVAAENSLEKVYAFYHPSFQEYFAALAISYLDSNYFLPVEHFNNSIPVKSKKYRIFLNYWKEVILFWIGRGDIESKVKEQFIHSLMCFHDNCENFYRFRALCLAIECLSEFNQVKYLDLLLNWMTSYAFILGSDNFDYLYNSNFAEDSKSILKNLNIKELSENLENRISKINLLQSQFLSDKSLGDLDKLEIAKILISINPSNKVAFDILAKLIENNTRNHTFITCDAITTISKSTYEFNNYPDKVVLILVELLNNEKYSHVLEDILKSLGGICKHENLNIIRNSIRDFLSKKDKLGNTEVIQHLKILLKVKENFPVNDIEDILFIYLKKLLTTHNNDEEILLDLILIIEKLNNISFLVSDLEELMLNSSEDLSLKISKCLIDFNCYNEKAIEYFMNHFSLPQDHNRLIKIAKNHKNIKNKLIELLQISLDLDLKFHVAEILFKIEPFQGNQAAIILLEMLDLDESKYGWIVLASAKTLLEFNLFTDKGIKAVQKILINKNDQITYQASLTLAHLMPKNISTIDKLLTLFNAESGDKHLISFDFKNINLAEQKGKVVKQLEKIIYSEADSFFDAQLDVYFYRDLPNKLNIKSYIQDLPYIASNLLEIDGSNLIAINFFIRLLKNIYTPEIRQISNTYYQPPRKERILNGVNAIIEFSHKDKFPEIVSNLQGTIINPEFKTKDYSRYKKCHQIVYHCSKNMSYQSFYAAWHSSFNVIDIQSLESQVIDFNAIQKKLDSTKDRPDEIRCIVVDIRQLEQESDPNVIIQKIVNRIFDALEREIPIIQNIAVFETVIINLQREPDVKKIAIALYGNSANEVIAQLCQNLAPIQTRLFTGGQTTQELITQINAWRSEM